MSVTDPATKAAVIADCLAGIHPSVAARTHGVSESSAYRWVVGTSEERKEAENALHGGHWTPNTRGVQVWQPCFYDTAQTCTINHQGVAA